MISRIKSWLVAVGVAVSLAAYTYFRGKSNAKQAHRVETIERGNNEIAKSKEVTEVVNSIGNDGLHDAASKWVRK